MKNENLVNTAQKIDIINVFILSSNDIICIKYIQHSAEIDSNFMTNYHMLCYILFILIYN